MVEAVHVGVEVALQVFGADRVVNAVDAPLGVAPETFNIVGMGASCNVLLGAVDHGFMGIAETGKVVVGSVFVGVDGSIVGMDVFLDHRDDGRCFIVGLYLNHGVALALNQAYHHGLAYGSAPGPELLARVFVGFLAAVSEPLRDLRPCRRAPPGDHHVLTSASTLPNRSTAPSHSRRT